LSRIKVAAADADIMALQQRSTSMSTGNIAYLILVGCGFAAFMATLSYGYIRCLPGRRDSAKAKDKEAAPLRKAA
jgi:hypothetical protein